MSVPVQTAYIFKLMPGFEPSSIRLWCFSLSLPEFMLQWIVLCDQVQHRMMIQLMCASISFESNPLATFIITMCSSSNQKFGPTVQLLHGQHCTCVPYFKIAHLQLTNNCACYSVFVRSLVYMNYQG